MLTPEEIEALQIKPWLSPTELGILFYTVNKLYVANDAQSKLLADSLAELDRLRSRLDFYRTTTTKLL